VDDGQSVPAQTVDTLSDSAQAVSVNEQGAAGETGDSETGAKEGEEEEKEEEKKTEDEESVSADASSAAKESSTVEGDDQKKRFVAFCLLDTPNGYLCCIG